MKLTLGQVADWIHAEGRVRGERGGVGLLDRFAHSGGRASCFLRCVANASMAMILCRRRWRMAQ